MEEVNGKKPHVLAVPLPAQGHVKPLIKLCRKIAELGIKVTFVNLESIHQKITSALRTSDEDEDEDGEKDNMELVTLPDPKDGEARVHDPTDDVVKMTAKLRATMPGSLKGLKERINMVSSPDLRISCVIADVAVSWILETAVELGAEPLLFMPASAALSAVSIHVPGLLERGFLRPDGA